MLAQSTRGLRAASSASSTRGPLAFLFGALPLFVVPILAAGCNGCESGNIQCDSNGNCTICDSYGCHDANPSPTTGSGSSHGGAGQGGASQTGTGQGGSSAHGGAGGTGPTCDATVVTCPCTDVAQCASGDSCINGLCLPGCNNDIECGAQKVCANGQCVAGCNAEVSCSAGYECVGGGCLVDTSNPQCTGPQDCSGAVCVNGLCTTKCALNADCPNGELCDSATKSCFPDPTPKPICGGNVSCPGIGQVCSADGYCRYPCSTVQECKLIDSRFVACDQSVCKTQEEVNPQCDLAHPCPNGIACVSNKCVP